jgi:hypothetical protein
VNENGQVIRHPQHADSRAWRAFRGGGRKRLPLLRLLLQDANPAACRAYGSFDDHRKAGACRAQRGDAAREDQASNHPPEHDPHRSEGYCERYLLSVAQPNTPIAKRSFPPFVPHPNTAPMQSSRFDLFVRMSRRCPTASLSLLLRSLKTVHKSAPPMPRRLWRSSPHPRAGFPV